MSSGTSYDWQLEVERERQRQSMLRAEFAALRQREESLRMLRTAARAHGVHAELPRVHEPGATATSGELSQAVTELRAGLDALEVRLTAATAERATQRAARWSVVLRRELGQPAAGPTGVLAAAKAVQETERVRAALSAAQELVQTEGYRCAPEDLVELTGRADRIGQLGPGPAAIALQDLEARVSESINRRLDAERAAQRRARLVCLLDEAAAHADPGTPDSAALAELRRQAAHAGPDTLTGLEPAVAATIEAMSRHRARAEVARRLAAALRERGYAVGEDFDDRLGSGGDAMVAACEAAPSYGLRIVIEPDHDVLRAAVVRRDDARADDDESVQELVCGDLEAIEQTMGEGGCTLAVTWRRERQASVPTMPGDRWPPGQAVAGTDRAEINRRLAEHRKQQQSRQRAKGSRP